LYQKIRNLREGKTSELPLETIFEIVSDKHPNDWLLSIEIADLLQKNGNEILLQKVLSHLEKIKKNRPIVAHLISGGLDLILRKEII
jgi:phenylalanine-4-hydroxylase